MVGSLKNKKVVELMRFLGSLLPFVVVDLLITIDSINNSSSSIGNGSGSSIIRIL